jgi:hypothetical protein
VGPGLAAGEEAPKGEEDLVGGWGVEGVYQPRGGKPFPEEEKTENP